MAQASASLSLVFIQPGVSSHGSFLLSLIPELRMAKGQWCCPAASPPHTPTTRCHRKWYLYRGRGCWKTDRRGSFSYPKTPSFQGFLISVYHQTQGPEFDPQHPHTKPDIVACMGNPSIVEAETGRSLGPSGQPASLTRPVRDHVSKHKVDGS